MSELAEVWAYLAEEPLLWLTLTVVVHEVVRWSIRRFELPAIWNPVLVSVVVIAAVLRLSDTDYASYFDGARFLHVMLGPATVALAVPLHASLGIIRRSFRPIIASLAAGTSTATLAAIGLAAAFGLSAEQIRSIAPKSATAPVAMGVSEAVGGSASLTAALVVLTGVVGASIATPLLDRIGSVDWRARGFAIGIASHGIGTARAIECHPTAGAFAGIGMAINAPATAVLVPILLLGVG